MTMMKNRCVVLAFGLLTSLSAVAGLVEGQKALKSGDSAKAIQEWSPLADQGDAEAQFRLGFLYSDGPWQTRDVNKAFMWYSKSAQKGHAIAQFKLGFMYNLGQGVAKNNDEAFKWYTMAAEQGVADAQFYLGDLYMMKSDNIKRQFLDENEVMAARMYALAAQQNHKDALERLGWQYEHERGVERDLVLAHVFYILAEAASGPYPRMNSPRTVKQLSPAQLREAQAIARAWKAGTPVPTQSSTGR